MNLAKKRTYTRGFKRTSVLLSDQIRKAGEGRGFAVSRVLTHWADIVGQDFAAKARPVDVSYGRGGLGATLTLLISPAHGPELEMSRERIRAKVNSAYGYNAIARLKFTQTSATGFAEAQAEFSGPDRSKPAPTPQIRSDAQSAAHGAENSELAAAIERLACNVLTNNQNRKEKT